MNISIWDKERKEYIEIHNVTFISTLDNEIKVEVKDNIIRHFNARRYTLDFIHGGI